MILFGAGASTPFNIPGMIGFTEQFIAENEDISKFVVNIKDAVSHSEEMVGISISFDLETLLSVLNDLSGVMKEKPISIPTASLLLKEGLSIRAAREKYGNDATSALETLRYFIFNKCMEPIKKGKEEGNFKFLDRFYGPLMTVLNFTLLKNVQTLARRIYSTNWDLCFKTWVDYINIPISDGTDLDKQSQPVFSVTKFDGTSSGFNYVPLHGSLDLIKISRPKGAGSYEDIFKISDPIRYFENKPANIKDVFIIYPLEAIGSEESIKSPYLDMLNNFRSSLREENTVFIVGYSLRDPTIGSIFEEVIAERIRNGDLNPLSENLDSRISEVSVSEQRLKIVVFNRDPDKLVENLKKQHHTNLLHTFVPIKIEFPKITDEDFDEKYTEILSQLIRNLVEIRYIDLSKARNIADILRQKYNLGATIKELEI